MRGVTFCLRNKSDALKVLVCLVLVTVVLWFVDSKVYKRKSLTSRQFHVPVTFGDLQYVEDTANSGASVSYPFPAKELHFITHRLYDAGSGGVFNKNRTWAQLSEQGQVLESFATPATIEKNSGVVANMVNFVTNVASFNGFIFNRVFRDNLGLELSDPSRFKATSAILSFEGDVTKGTFSEGKLFPHSSGTERIEGKQETFFRGHVVRFVYNNKPYSFNCGDYVVDQYVSVTDSAITILFTSGIGVSTSERVLDIVFSFKHRKGFAYSDWEISLKVRPGVKLQNVQLDLNTDPVYGAYTGICKFAADKAEIIERQQLPEQLVYDQNRKDDTKPKWVSVYQKDSYIESRSLVRIFEEESLKYLSKISIKNGPTSFRDFTVTYVFGDLDMEAALAIRERVVNLSGTIYTEWTQYDSVFSSLPSFKSVDLSVSGYADEVNGVASVWAADSKRISDGDLKASPEICTTNNREWIDSMISLFIRTFVNRFESGEYQHLHSPEVSSMILACERMYTATKSELYKQHMQTLADVLINNFHLGNGFSCRAHERVSQIDCNSAAILALARAYKVTNNYQYIEHALQALRHISLPENFLSSGGILKDKHISDDIHRSGLVFCDGENIFQGYSAGLTLRAVNAVRNSYLAQVSGDKKIAALLGLITSNCLQYIKTIIQPRALVFQDGSTLPINEVAVSFAERQKSNARTQASVVLGLMASE